MGRSGATSMTSPVLCSSQMTFEVSEGNACASLLGSSDRTKLEQPHEQLVDVNKPEDCLPGDGDLVSMKPGNDGAIEPPLLEPKLDVPTVASATLPRLSASERSKSRQLYCGLKNLGMTCYSNSILQVLFTLNKIRRHFLRNDDSNGGTFHQILSRLFHHMRKLSSHSSSNYMALKPDEFCREFRHVKPQFLRNEQHDAQEFLALLLDLLHDECNGANVELKRTETLTSAHEAWTQHVAAVDDSFFSKHLMGQTESCLTCHTCGNNSLSWSCFWQLPLAVNEKKADKGDSAAETLTLMDCIDEYMEAEILSNDCAPFCEKCDRREPASKKLTVVRSPHYLVVHLKRFAETGSKITRPVEILSQLELCGKLYSLCCCVLHRGGELHQGHYTTLACESDLQPPSWVLCDDDTITRGLPEEKAHKMMQRYAYLCVYKSINFPVKSTDKTNSDQQQQQAEG